MKNFKKILLVAVALFVNDSFGMMSRLAPKITTVKIIFDRTFSSITNIKDFTQQVVSRAQDVVGGKLDRIDEKNNKIVKSITNYFAQTSYTKSTAENVVFFNDFNISLSSVKDFLLDSFAYHDSRVQGHVMLHFDSPKKVKKAIEEIPTDSRVTDIVKIVIGKDNCDTKIITDNIKITSMFMFQSSKKCALVFNFKKYEDATKVMLRKNGVKAKLFPCKVDTVVAILDRLDTICEDKLITLYGSNQLEKFAKKNKGNKKTEKKLRISN